MDRNNQQLIFLRIAFVVFLSSRYVISEESSNPIGHMQPLGSHMSPILVEERDSVPDPKEFFERYVKPGVPVVLKNAAQSMPNYETWRDDDYLRKKFGDWPAGYKKNKKEGSDLQYADATFAEFLDIYQNEDIYFAQYITSDNPMTDEIALLKCMACGGYVDLIHVLPFFFSSGGTKSALHRDEANNLSCMLDGSKEWIIFDRIYSPDIPTDGPQPGYCGVDPEKVDMYQYPIFQNLSWHHAKVERGDCFFLPYGWPHHVISHEGRNMAVNVFWMYMHVIDLKDCPSDMKSVPSQKPVGKIWSTEKSEMRSFLLTAFMDGTTEISVEDFVSHVMQNVEDESGLNYEQIRGLDTNLDGIISEKEILEYSFEEITDDDATDESGAHKKEEL